jgi:NADH-quinone oxidoreductase subunit G
MCTKGRDIAAFFGRARAEQAMLKGRPVDTAAAIANARELVASAKRPVALVSSWGSNEELAAFKAALGSRFEALVKTDVAPAPGETLADDVLIRPDKNPNGAGARALFGAAPPRVPDAADLVLVWGEGADFGALPRGARIIFLNAWLQPENGHADVFFPISVQTERAGTYTNCTGIVSAFSPCFAKADTVADAEALFEALAVGTGSPA